MWFNDDVPVKFNFDNARKGFYSLTQDPDRNGPDDAML
jgi:hypothetical protein